MQAALDRLLESRKRTTIVIAHRLSTIRNADKIVVLNKVRRRARNLLRPPALDPQGSDANVTRTHLVMAGQSRGGRDSRRAD